MRQWGEAQAAFRRALLGVSEGLVTIDDNRLVSSRMRSNDTPNEASTFNDDAVHRFPTNAAADFWNWQWLQGLVTLMARINVSHTRPGYSGVSADRFLGLQSHL